MRFYPIFTLALALAGCDQKAEMAAKAPERQKAYVEIPLASGTVSQSITWKGTISTSEKVDIMVDAKTKIAKTIAKNGMRVKTGDTLFELDKSDEEKKLQEQRDNYKKKTLEFKSTVLQFKNTKKTWERKGRLFKRGVIARQEFETAELAYEQGKNDLQRKKLDLEKLRDDVKELANVSTVSKIVAPRDGVISKVAFLSPGSEVNLGQKLCTISNSDSLAISALVREAELNQLTEGMELIIRLDSRGDTSFTGKLLTKARSGTYQPAAGGMVYEITVELPAELKDSREGATGEIEFVIAKKDNTLSVPLAAIKSVGEDEFVLLGGGIVGDPTPTRVKTGIRTSTEIEILEGLTAGQTILLQQTAM